MTPSKPPMFNMSQLASWEQARDLAKQLTDRGIGRGVKPESADPNQSGIYTELWLPGPGSFPEPHYFDEQTNTHYYPFHFRFNNGAAGMNVGMVLAKFKSFPMSPGYVWENITREVNSMAVSD